MSEPRQIMFNDGIQKQKQFADQTSLCFRWWSHLLLLTFTDRTGSSFHSEKSSSWRSSRFRNKRAQKLRFLIVMGQNRNIKITSKLLTLKWNLFFCCSWWCRGDGYAGRCLSYCDRKKNKKMWNKHAQPQFHYFTRSVSFHGPKLR